MTSYNLPKSFTKKQLDEARKQAGLLSTQEMNEILSWETSVIKESVHIVNIGIPEMLKFIDFLYPAQKLIGFDTYLRKRGQHE